MEATEASLRNTQEVCGYLRKDPPFGAGVCVTQNASKEEFKNARLLMTEPKTVSFFDARSAKGGLASWDLEKHGFCCVRPPVPSVDLSNSKLVRQSIYPKVIELAKRVTGAKDGFIYSHLMRDESSKGGNSYARFAHSDACAESPPLWRLQLMDFGVLEEEAKTCDILMVNLWHPRDRPAYKDPLCLLDFSSLAPEEAAPSGVEMVRYVVNGGERAFQGGEASTNPKRDRKFLEIFFSKTALDLAPQGAPVPAPSNGSGLCGPNYAPHHRWIFCSDMRPDEGWIFKQFDTRDDGRAKMCFHNSFHDPFHDPLPETPGRRSAEYRILLTFPKGWKPAAAGSAQGEGGFPEVASSRL